MKIAQYIYSKNYKRNEKSFQAEVWEQHWSKQSVSNLIKQLEVNPVFWNLLSKVKKSYKMLEAGCGYGQWVIALHQLGFNIKGVDIAKNTLKRIKKFYPSADVRIADVESLPFKDGSFDVYLSFGVIEHFEKGPRKVLNEAKRVLKKNGLLYLTVPYLNIPRLIKYGLSLKKKGRFYQYLYTKNEVIKLISEAGFEVASVKYFDFINAVKKDIPFAHYLINAFLSKRTKKELDNHEKKRQVSIIAYKNKPSYGSISSLQKLLYKLDSYIILIEAYKK